MAGKRVWIEGARVVLRDFSEADLDVLAFWLQPDQRWQELDGPLYEQPGPDDAARILDNRRRFITSDPSPRIPLWLTIASIDTGEMLGEVSWNGAGHASGRTGLNIVIYNPDLWGYGLGFEAFGLWCDCLLRSQPDLEQLDLQTWSGNKGMLRLARKLGFEEVKQQRRRRLLTGRGTRIHGFVLARETWISRYPDGFAGSLGGER
jgi:putative hydrolase of HD superfamily